MFKPGTRVKSIEPIYYGWQEYRIGTVIEAHPSLTPRAGEIPVRFDKFPSYDDREQVKDYHGMERSVLMVISKPKPKWRM